MTTLMVPLQGWKTAWRMLLYMMSTTSPFFDRNRRPFACASSMPMVLRPLSTGRMMRSTSRGTFWFFRLPTDIHDSIHTTRHNHQ